jgi:phosphoglycolate phosphatase
MVILSASKETLLLEQLAQYPELDGCFDRVMGLTDIYAVSKVQRGVDFLREAGIPSDEAVFLGDTLHDAEVARAMGCQCLLIAGGHQKEETLRASGATVLPTLREAGDWIMERRGYEA